jgi:hypothetical protein
VVKRRCGRDHWPALRVRELVLRREAAELLRQARLPVRQPPQVQRAQVQPQASARRRHRRLRQPSRPRRRQP